MLQEHINTNRHWEIQLSASYVSFFSAYFSFLFILSFFIFIFIIFFSYLLSFLSPATFSCLVYYRAALVYYSTIIVADAGRVADAGNERKESLTPNFRSHQCNGWKGCHYYPQKPQKQDTDCINFLCFILMMTLKLVIDPSMIIREREVSVIILLSECGRTPGGEKGDNANR